jgi:hypothetical protein
MIACSTSIRWLSPYPNCKRLLALAVHADDGLEGEITFGGFRSGLGGAAPRQDRHRGVPRFPAWRQGDSKHPNLMEVPGAERVNGLCASLGRLVVRARFRAAKSRSIGACARGATPPPSRGACLPFVALSRSYGHMTLPPCYPTIILLAAFLTLTGCGSVTPEVTTPSVTNEQTAAPTQSEMRDLTPAEKSILAEGFAAGLDDPDSAKFLWTKIPTHLSGTAFEYCALINVKGVTGTYTGMKPFLATIRTENGSIIGGAIAALNNDNLAETREVIPKLCRQKGLNPFDAR